MRKYDLIQSQKALQLLQQGLTQKQVAAQTGINLYTVRNISQQNNINPRGERKRSKAYYEDLTPQEIDAIKKQQNPRVGSLGKYLKDVGYFENGLSYKDIKKDPKFKQALEASARRTFTGYQARIEAQYQIRGILMEDEGFIQGPLSPQEYNILKNRVKKLGLDLDRLEKPQDVKKTLDSLKSANDKDNLLKLYDSRTSKAYLRTQHERKNTGGSGGKSKKDPTEKPIKEPTGKIDKMKPRNQRLIKKLQDEQKPVETPKVEPPKEPEPPKVQAPTPPTLEKEHSTKEEPKKEIPPKEEAKKEPSPTEEPTGDKIPISRIEGEIDDSRLPDIEKKRLKDTLREKYPDGEIPVDSPMWNQLKRLLDYPNNRPIPIMFDEQGNEVMDPTETLRQAVGRRSKKSKVATENWFRCARIEFGQNIPRLPVLIDLAMRVAEKDPNLLFKARTEIDYWYHIFGWQRCDELIENLEAESGLKASTDIKVYNDNEDRNKRIRRFYAKKIRFRVREDVRATMHLSGTELENEVRKRMREIGYEY